MIAILIASLTLHTPMTYMNKIKVSLSVLPSVRLLTFMSIFFTTTNEGLHLKMKD